MYYEITFGQVSVNQAPHVQESDDRYALLFPHEARLRNMTYSTEIYVNVSVNKYREAKAPVSEKVQGGFRPVITPIGEDE